MNKKKNNQASNNANHNRTEFANDMNDCNNTTNAQDSSKNKNSK